jgi:hypothetical protein
LWLSVLKEEISSSNFKLRKQNVKMLLILIKRRNKMLPMKHWCRRISPRSESL